MELAGDGWHGAISWHASNCTYTCLCDIRTPLKAVSDAASTYFMYFMLFTDGRGKLFCLGLSWNEF